MPNTNPSDLDQDDWVASVFVSNHGVDMDLEAHIACKLPDGAHKLYAHPALPRASGVPEAEAVAWRFDWHGNGEWQITDSKKGMEYVRDKGKRFEPLHASPPPVAAPSGEAIARTLAKRTHAMSCSGGGDYYAKIHFSNLADLHEFADAMLAHPSSIASEPKGAGSVEGPQITVREQKIALLSATVEMLTDAQINEALYGLHSRGFSITRTAPSGAKPGEVKP